jgi:spoIIIJ-associated protein
MGAVVRRPSRVYLARSRLALDVLPQGTASPPQTVLPRRRFLPRHPLHAERRRSALGAGGEPVSRLDPEVADAADILEELLDVIARALELDADVDVEFADGVLTGRLDGHDLGLFIGRHGQTIDAVQHLAQRIVLGGEASGLRIVVDADGYRARRARTLRAQADDAAEEALRTGRPVELSAMAALDRRLVHEHLRDRAEVETYSEGAEPDRYLVVCPARG